MSERSKLKKTLINKIASVENEIDKLRKTIADGKNVDYAVCYTRLSELQQRLSDLNELNQICVDRNRY